MNYKTIKALGVTSLVLLGSSLAAVPVNLTNLSNQTWTLTRMHGPDNPLVHPATSWDTAVLAPSVTLTMDPPEEGRFYYTLVASDGSIAAVRVTADPMAAATMEFQMSWVPGGSGIPWTIQGDGSGTNATIIAHEHRHVAYPAAPSVPTAFMSPPRRTSHPRPTSSLMAPRTIPLNPTFFSLADEDEVPTLEFENMEL